MALLSLAACDGGDSGGDAGTDSGPPPPSCPSDPIPEVVGTRIAAGASFESPVFLTQAPGRADVLFVVEQSGRIRIVERDGSDTVRTFLDLGDRVAFFGERGLLGLAFHPAYESNGRFFVYYTPDDQHQNVVAEYRRSAADPDVADPTEVARLMEITDPEDNHNGGSLGFGHDGLLYVGVGDGGAGGDPHGQIGNGLDRSTLLGKILRLDVDRPDADYGATGNPFSGADGLPQIWAYGVRNPWRFSFDRVTGDFWLGDVGQNSFEEINVRLASDPPGANFGWRAYEGFEVFDAATTSLVTDHAEPVFVIDRRDPHLRNACSITGGYVYRGSAIPALAGTYIFGDYCSRDIGALRYCDGQVRDATVLTGLDALAGGLAGFGQDLEGELYLVYQNPGAIFRIDAP